MTFFSPFRLRFNGMDSAVVGGSGLFYNNANLTSAINAIPGFAGTATVTGAASTGFTVTYTGASAGIDVPSLSFVGLSCGGCFGSVEETTHGGANDSFTLTYNGNTSAPITNGTNYTTAGISAALTPILPAGTTVTVAGFGGGTFNNTGFQVTLRRHAGHDERAVPAPGHEPHRGHVRLRRRDRQGRGRGQQGHHRRTRPATRSRSSPRPPSYTIPLRTPFALTGSATDGDGDALTYSWEQNDRGGTAGSSLLSNTKTNGPLFAMFPLSAPISESDTLLYNSPDENHLTTSPTRVFPDLQQILDNNTNADTGSCPTGPIAPPVPIPVKECFSEFLPTTRLRRLHGRQRGAALAAHAAHRA